MTALSQTLSPSALLDELLARAESTRPVLEACVEEGEQTRSLPLSAVKELEAAGLLKMKAPKELGGFEAPPSVQFQVLGRLAEINTAAAWCTMVCNNGVGVLGAFLSPDGANEVFSDGHIPKVAGVAAPSGTAVPVSGGFHVSGTWKFASGIRHSEWLQVVAVAQTEQKEVVTFAVPSKDATIIDTWHVVGLRGTGSCDFSLENYFVPTKRSFIRRPDDPAAVRQRGGALFALPYLSFVTYEHAGVAFGLGRRALAMLHELTDPKTGHPGLRGRGDVLAQIGKDSVRLAAAASWAMKVHDALIDDINAGGLPGQGGSTAAQASGCMVTEVAVDIVTALFRYSGARALYTPNEIERLFRDVNAAAEHIVSGNQIYLSQARLPFPLGAST